MNLSIPEQPLAQPKAEGAKALSRYLREGMATGALGVGVKLPAERELSERFGASRGAVRRVLAEFRERGLITQSVGSGTFVARAPVSPAAPAGLPSTLDGDVSPAELMVARRLIEPLMPGLIVRNATAADFATMQHCIEQSEAAETIEAFEHWDGALHTALAVATHNGFFVRILELTQRVRDQGEWGRLKARSLNGTRRAQYEQQHRALVDALRDRDAEAAERLLVQHLDQIQRNLFGD
ncbi:FadR/GntR family transcriptional regulator [Xylophilus sp. Leaf220]|uniref:FadR/GntR family transcriptional regulator n=1 Tax=Xylophilus sp. Leaf220 TaxID=1735686 RepID=UPI0006FB6ABD|nr:FCD domain-containing protein [Xylophilus sp. Leaf220]KQM78025.1 GntR family transcriptional regulator [Xylophilus sp. Leaf220]